MINKCMIKLWNFLIVCHWLHWLIISSCAFMVGYRRILRILMISRKLIGLRKYQRLDCFVISCGLILLIMILESYKHLSKTMMSEDVRISLDSIYLNNSSKETLFSLSSEPIRHRQTVSRCTTGQDKSNFQQ